jgi:hypothetical protein
MGVDWRRRLKEKVGAYSDLNDSTINQLIELVNICVPYHEKQDMGVVDDIADAVKGFQAEDFDNEGQPKDRTDTIQAIHKGRFKRKVIYSITTNIPFSEEKAEEILDKIVKRLKPGEFEPEVIDNIIKYIIQSYPKITKSTRRFWQKRSCVDIRISDEKNEIALESFDIFINRAVDTIIINNMILRRTKEDYKTRKKISDSMVDDGVCRPILWFALLEDTKDKALSDSKESVETHTLDIMMSLIKAFGVEEAARKQEGLLDNFRKINKETDTTKQIEFIKTLIENIGAPADLAEDVSEIFDDMNTIHSIAINTVKTAKEIKEGSGIVSIIIGSINLLLIPIQCAVEGRWPPTKEELGKMLVSSVTIVLGALLCASIGGPIALGVYFLGLSLIGLGRATFAYGVKTREIKRLTRLAETKMVERDALMETIIAIDKLISEKIKIIQGLLAKRPDEIPFSVLESHLSKEKKENDEMGLLQLQALRREKIKEYIKTASEYAEVDGKRNILDNQNKMIIHKLTKNAYVMATGLAVIGAIVFLIAPPIGAGILIAAAALSSATLLISVAHKAYSYFFKKKSTSALSSIQSKELEKDANEPLFDKYHLYPSGSIDYKLMGMDVSPKDRPHQQKKTIFKTTPLSKFFSPQKTKPLEKEEDSTIESPDKIKKLNSL